MSANPQVEAIVSDVLAFDVETLKRALVDRLTYTVGKDHHTATTRDWMHSLAYVVRDRLAERWMETMRSYYDHNAKRVYYLSLEFLLGRALTNSMLNMGFFDNCQQALQELGMDFEEIRDLEFDAALGNGGLGRLAACFLDSLASLQLPGYGYGIRYEYGMFRQGIENGEQVEHPDNWLRYGNAWEFPRPEVLYPVKFYGKVIAFKDEKGRSRNQWCNTEEVMAMAYDMPIPGYKTNTVNTLRLWSAKASRDFDLSYFNEGNYIKAVEDKNQSENLSKVLYPADNTAEGRELRLKQQYFFVSAAMQDILHRFNKQYDSLQQLPDKVAIQLNDTHPAIAIAELMHILVDQYQMQWDEAWNITRETFAYTNHTLLPEALETWPVELMDKVLPRHLQIIYEINHRFLRDVTHWRPGDTGLLQRMSLIDEHNGKRVRMANLAIVGSHTVNGVAALHSSLLRSNLFQDFDAFFTGKFINITNGITPRRWLNLANPKLAKLICSYIGDAWLRNLGELKKLALLADNDDFQEGFAQAKQHNKIQLADMIHQRLGIEVDPDSLFDVQVKRIHEYKRQLLNLLHVITLYNRIRRNPQDNYTPRTIIFSGKAAPGYFQAKLIIRLINDVADIINNDPALGHSLKVVFVPNYDVSTAMNIIPAANLSEQISTAGMEASGTGNMKLALNGALTIGTLDGANVEMREEVGEENFFIFGLTAAEVEHVHASDYNPWHYYDNNAELRQALDMINTGYFSHDEPGRYKAIFDSLTYHGDHYLLLADYQSYINCQDEVAALYQQPRQWNRKAILNFANMGKFSTDRTIEEYAGKVWRIKPVFRD
ncbi:MAG: glycogen/starch/alpha-glucan phosphorylase [Gammaproteobacteria bacterium]|nr:glycogen/starch/alpha-glucan phosphorylase [Gammaproteobacteria bacterium]